MDTNIYIYIYIYINIYIYIYQRNAPANSSKRGSLRLAPIILCIFYSLFIIISVCGALAARIGFAVLHVQLAGLSEDRLVLISSAC